MAAHPRIAPATGSTPPGSFATEVEGMTQYSASPPIEYIQMGLPSRSNRRVVSS